MKARDNPFSTDRVLRVRYRLHGVTWDDLMDRLAALSYRAAIVGPEGSGKTTLLEDLEPRLRAQGFDILYLQLDRTTRRFPPGFLDRFCAGLSPRDVILFDGAEQMSRPAWQRFMRQSRKAGGLVITSHRAGLLPSLLECSTTPQLLDEIVHELLGTAAAALGNLPHRLYHKHDGNLRDALRELYDIYAEDTSPD
ncbi:MAG: hypothetical protein M3347_03055 [Armatimonadota bacterium]|nr:hypothetical protein [Armatimonadota bacterium]